MLAKETYKLWLQALDFSFSFSFSSFPLSFFLPPHRQVTIESRPDMKAADLGQFVDADIDFF